MATTNSSSSNNNNSRSRSHSVQQLPPLGVLGLALLVSAPTTILRTTPAVVYLAILARPTLLLGKLSSSQHSAALGLKTKTRPIPNHLSEALVLSSNRIKSLVDCLDKIQTTLGEVVCLGPRTRTINNRLLQEVFLGRITTTISRLEARSSHQSQLRRVVVFSGRPIQATQTRAVALSRVLATTITMPTRTSKVKPVAFSVATIINSKSPGVCLAALQGIQVACLRIRTITTNSLRVVVCSARPINSSSSKVEAFSAIPITIRIQVFLAIHSNSNSNQTL